MQLIDFTNCENGYRAYDGSDNKTSIVYMGEKYMLKLPDNRYSQDNSLKTKDANKVLAEYIGSHIFAILGIPVHETILGTYQGKLAVACKDFTGNGYRLQEFSWFMRSYYTSSQIGRIPAYNQIYEVPRHHPLLVNIGQQVINRYWETFVIDALIGNFDRHKGNWGFLVSENTRTIKLAPVYDCGSSLYPGLSEDEMQNVLKDPEEIEKRMYEFPKATLNKTENVKKEEKFGYYELLSSGMDQNCNKSLKELWGRIELKPIFEMIEGIPVLSDIRIEFYEKMLEYRKDMILGKAVNMLSSD